MALHRTDVVGAALAIVDQYGIGDLTMRRLAERLGVQPGALYWHLPNKQSLLAAVSDVIVGEVALPPDGDDWRTWLGEWAGGLRRTLLGHRDGAELVASTRATGLGSTDWLTGPRDRLVAAGLGPGAASDAVQVLTHFVLGQVYEEQNRAQLAELGVSEPADAVDAERLFRFGLEVIVTGLAHRAPTLAMDR